MSKQCAACGEMLNNGDFSKRQRALAATDRRCLRCVDAERSVPLKLCSCLPQKARFPTSQELYSSQVKNHARWQQKRRSKEAFGVKVDDWNGTAGPGGLAYASGPATQARADWEVRSAAEWANSPTRVGTKTEDRDKALRQVYIDLLLYSCRSSTVHLATRK
jgi:hypothetical protein